MEEVIPIDLLRMALLSHRFEKRLADDIGLSVLELHCMIQLFVEKPCCVRKLTEMLGVEPTSTSKILRALDRCGYITRSLDDHDRRMERVALTHHGVKVIARVLSAARVVWEDVLLQFPPDRRLAFMECFHTLTTVFPSNLRSFSAH
ncbi:MAG: winged helix-turn-helix transcriptional regulator [Ignavibacteriae bacterium]|nr:winged helix-turn-helix transcriptional regulator [Ignavibacteriota bacterium]